MLRQILLNGKKFLKEKSAFENYSYALDAELLLMYALDIKRPELFTKDNMEISETNVRKYMSLIKERASGRPVQYLTGKCEFMSLDFSVNENVLIPRPDTEILVEELIAYIKNKDSAEIIEIGAGSGCISVSLCKYCENIHITAADISGDALAIAKKNAESNNVEKFIDFVLSDLFSNISVGLKGNTDVIVSNPPYIKTADIDGLSVNVQGFEPRIALDGKSDGLYFYREIAKQGYDFLKTGALLIFEIGFDQKEDVENIMLQNNYSDIRHSKDLAGKDRVIYGFKQ